MAYELGDCDYTVRAVAMGVDGTFPSGRRVPSRSGGSQTFSTRDPIPICDKIPWPHGHFPTFPSGDLLAREFEFIAKNARAVSLWNAAWLSIGEARSVLYPVRSYSGSRVGSRGGYQFPGGQEPMSVVAPAETKQAIASLYCDSGGSISWQPWSW